jgi:chromosome segregation ATPase
MLPWVSGSKRESKIISMDEMVKHHARSVDDIRAKLQRMRKTKDDLKQMLKESEAERNKLSDILLHSRDDEKQLQEELEEFEVRERQSRDEIDKMDALYLKEKEDRDQYIQGTYSKIHQLERDNEDFRRLLYPEEDDGASTVATLTVISIRPPSSPMERETALARLANHSTSPDPPVQE